MFTMILYLLNGDSKNRRAAAWEKWFHLSIPLFVLLPDLTVSVLKSLVMWTDLFNSVANNDGVT